MTRKRVSEKDLILSTPVAPRHKPAGKRSKRSAEAVGVPVATQPEPATPTREQIAALAYSYWESRGGQGGSPEEDWLRAELELTAGPNLTATATA